MIPINDFATIVESEKVYELNWKWNEPSDPSAEKGKGHSMVGLGAKNADDLRDFCYSPEC